MCECSERTYAVMVTGREAKALLQAIREYGYSSYDDYPDMKDVAKQVDAIDTAANY